MSMVYPFSPSRGGTTTTAPNATSVDVLFPALSIGEKWGSLLVTNAGTVLAFVRIQNTAGSVAASAVDTPILPGQSRVLQLGYRNEPYTVSVFATAATTVYVTPGEGGV